MKKLKNMDEFVKILNRMKVGDYWVFERADGKGEYLIVKVKVV